MGKMTEGWNAIDFRGKYGDGRMKLRTVLVAGMSFLGTGAVIAGAYVIISAMSS